MRAPTTGFKTNSGVPNKSIPNSLPYLLYSYRPSVIAIPLPRSPYWSAFATSGGTVALREVWAVLKAYAHSLFRGSGQTTWDEVWEALKSTPS